MQGIKIYRPNNDMAKGWAIQFNLSYDRRENMAIFVEAARQIGPKPAPGSTESPFDWKNKIRFMLNANELGEIGACIRGFHVKNIKFLHQTGEGENQKLGAFTLEFPATEQAMSYGNWKIGLFNRRGGVDSRIDGFITPSELYQLLILIDYTFMRNFSNDPRKKNQADVEASTQEG